MTYPEMRNAYRNLMIACKAEPAVFNRKVRNLLIERTDGEQNDFSPEQYLDGARELAYYVYNIDWRCVRG